MQSQPLRERYTKALRDGDQEEASRVVAEALRAGLEPAGESSVEDFIAGLMDPRLDGGEAAAVARASVSWLAGLDIVICVFNLFAACPVFFYIGQSAFL